MIELFAVLLAAIVLGTVAFILIPLRRFPPTDFTRDDPTEADRLAAREAALQTIRDLDFDYRLGNLTEADYRELRERHKLHAIALLKAASRRSATQGDGLDLQIEQAVRTLRQERRAIPGETNGTARPPDPVAPGGLAGPACPACVAPLRATDRFCSACGTAVAAARPTAERNADPEPSGASATARPQVAERPQRTVSTEEPGERRRARNPLVWALGGGLAALVVIVGVGGLALTARSAQDDQQAIGRLPAEVQGVRALTFFAGWPETVLAGHAGGVLFSEDGGRSWRSASTSGEVRAIASPPERAETIYLAGPNLLQRSEDGGATWTALQAQLPGPDLQALATVPGDPHNLYGVIGGQGLFRSTDGGDQWSLVAETMPRHVTALVATGDGYLYLATADQGVLASQGGHGWAPASGFVTGALPTLRIAALGYDPRSGDSYLTPTGERLTGALYAGTDQGLFKSIDGGTSWFRLPLRTDVRALAVHPDNSQEIVIVDSAGRVFRSTDRGVTWRGDH